MNAFLLRALCLLIAFGRQCSGRLDGAEMPLLEGL
jgi:hypothetical protein